MVAVLVASAMSVDPSGTSASGPRLAVAYVTGSATSAPAVWLARLDGGGARRIGLGADPLLSPDGSLVAASSARGLVLYSASGGGSHRYFNTPAATARASAFSPDSRYLVVLLSSTDPGSAAPSGLAVIDTATFASRILVRDQIYGASFAPDGSERIAYASAASLALRARIDIHVVGADGSGAKQITHDGRSLNPVWGPRGIAFDHERLRAQEEPAYQVWITAGDGRERRQLTHLRIPPLREGLVPIAFSGTGALLLTEYVGEDTSQAWLLRMSSSRAAALGANVVAAGLSHDGRDALVDRGGFLQVPNRGVVESLPVAGGRPRVLVAHGSEASWNA